MHTIGEYWLDFQCKLLQLFELRVHNIKARVKLLRFNFLEFLCDPKYLGIIFGRTRAEKIQCIRFSLHLFILLVRSRLLQIKLTACKSHWGEENASGFEVHDLRLAWWLHRNLINPRIRKEFSVNSVPLLGQVFSTNGEGKQASVWGSAAQRRD